MKTAQTEGGLRKAKLHSPPAVAMKVFIGYADLPAVRRATGCVGETARASKRNVEIEPLLWRVQQLMNSHWRDRSIQAALEADIVILTSSSPGALPPDLERWVNRFLNAARGRRANLVIIAGGDAWTISIERAVKQPQALPQEIPAATAQKLVA